MKVTIELFPGTLELLPERVRVDVARQISRTFEKRQARMEMQIARLAQEMQDSKTIYDEAQGELARPYSSKRRRGPSTVNVEPMTIAEPAEL